MEPFRIAKYHGLGNDFIVISDAAFPGSGPGKRALWAQKICDRHRGVGADGVILFDIAGEPESPRAEMTVFNRDGSRPEMCGNGIRCLIRHLDALEEFEGDEIIVDTDAGERTCRVVSRQPDDWRVEVDMGEVTAAEAPEKIGIGESDFTLWPVDVGNPHAVTFGSVRDELMDTVGATLNNEHYLFPDGVNVEFAEVVGESALRVEVFERGVGRTMACGTGACAAAVAALDQRKVPADAPVTVELPGGTLEVSRTDGTVWLRGGCQWVAHGEIAADWLAVTKADIDDES